MTRQMRMGLVNETPSQRLRPPRALPTGRRAALAGALAILAGCRGVPPALRPPSPPADRAAVFHAFLAGEPSPPLASSESPWQVLAEPPATAESSQEGLRLTSAPGRRVWASPRLPISYLNAAPAGQVEELTWETVLTLSQRFFVICELRFAGETGALLVQATPFDLQVFQDADRPGGGTSTSVSRLVGNGRPHAWRLRLDGQGLDLRLDSSTIWSLPGAHPLARVAFGETRTDGLHGGTMLLRDVVYVRRPA